jgi:peptide/nickel transport system permease protein
VGSFLARRLLLGVGVLTAVSYGTFALMATRFSSTCVSAFTPTDEFAPPLAKTVGQASRLYWAWLKGVPSGRSFGEVCNGQTTQQLGPAFTRTAALLAATGILVVIAALAIGTIGATRAGSLVDGILRLFSYAAWAIPPFVLALLLQSVLLWADGRGFHAFAPGGWIGTCLIPAGSFVQVCQPSGHGVFRVVEILRHLTIPAVSLSVAFIGLHSRYLRSSLLVTLRAQYTTTARAKGLPERIVVLRHALRNSLATFVSALLFDFGAIFGAAMAVDAVFHLNGMGSLLIAEIGGVGGGDGPRFLNPYAIETLLAAAAAFVVGVSVLSEIAAAAFDPRSRLT